jgi:hypothetical protein
VKTGRDGTVLAVSLIVSGCPEARAAEKNDLFVNIEDAVSVQVFLGQA